MNEKTPVDVHKVALEAAAETHNPRAQRCWPWNHRWTEWRAEFERRRQIRTCVRCGKTRVSKLPYHAGPICVLSGHRWVMVSTHAVWGETTSRPVAHRYILRCTHCGDEVERLISGVVDI